MTLTLGAAHVCSVPTVFTIAQPIGVSVHLSGVPSYVPHDVGSPSEYHGLGRLNFGNSLGYRPHVQLVTSPQLVYPLDPELTLVSVNMLSGITVTLDEIVRPAAVSVPNMPWDRNPAPLILGGSYFTAGGIGVTQLWTYTVPTGRKLFVAGLHCYTVRQTQATTPGLTYVRALIGGLVACWLAAATNTIGEHTYEESSIGLVLPAGTVISGDHSSSDVGGQYFSSVQGTGYLFDA